MENPQNDIVLLKCVKEHNKLRIKIVSPGYVQQANCQFFKALLWKIRNIYQPLADKYFPRDIRVDGREYSVPKTDVFMAQTKGKFFYRIGKKNIKIIEDILSKDKYKDLKIYGEENLTTCSICFDDIDTTPEICFVIFVPCGHYVCCDRCAFTCKEKGCCPMCRAKIEEIITKNQLQ